MNSVEFKNLFSHKEQDLYLYKKNKGSIAVRYALKILLKENIQTDLICNEIEILNNELGKPYLNYLNLKFSSILNEKGIKKIDFSLSHSRNNAVALLVIEK